MKKVKHIYSRCPKKFEEKLQEFITKLLDKDFKIYYSTASNKFEDSFSAIVIYE